jgi:hypothetical protein
MHTFPGLSFPINSRTTVTAPALTHVGKDVFEVFRSLLVHPDSFDFRTVEEVFGPTIRGEHADLETAAWSEYLSDRYTFLSANG